MLLLFVDSLGIVWFLHGGVLRHFYHINGTLSGVGPRPQIWNGCLVGHLTVKSDPRSKALVLAVIPEVRARTPLHLLYMGLGRMSRM
jgi:hypothetical protein